MFVFFSYVIGSFMSIFLYGLTDPFISIYYGKSFVLSNFIILFMSINILLSSFQFASNRFIVANGLVGNELRFSITATIINIIVSVILAYDIGAVGVLIGTTIANIILLLGQDWIVNKYVINLSFKVLLKKYFLVLLTIMEIFVLSFVNLPHTILWWLMKAFICLLVWLLSLLCFYKWKEFNLFVDVIKNTISKMKKSA